MDEDEDVDPESRSFDDDPEGTEASHAYASSLEEEAAENAA